MAQKLTVTSPAGANCLQPSEITLRYPRSLVVYFIFVLIVRKPLKKAQNISLLIHGNVSVLSLLLLLLFFFPKEAGEMFSATNLTATPHAV